MPTPTRRRSRPRSWSLRPTGSLDLRLDGSFTYRPAATFAGPDSFTYTASDGNAASSPATVTIVVVPSRYAPRPTVNVSTAVVAGRLQVTVEALPLDGQPVASGQTVAMPASATQAVATVERVRSGPADDDPTDGRRRVRKLA